MTSPEAQALLKEIIQAKDQVELQQLISRHLSRCDGVFFAELEAMVAQFKTKGDEASARKLKDLGDALARLRFMI
jgi:hypothetical protein